ncbi:unnamed protein product [Meganyctiphanes norvegica]|uniref:C2H2-type domain-containing protein n=1 Tax=Meganyctiphanes norvegica TaxID=48144 RepID=A0AAV2S3J4_MEGNR
MNTSKLEDVLDPSSAVINSSVFQELSSSSGTQVSVSNNNYSATVISQEECIEEPVTPHFKEEALTSITNVQELPSYAYETNLNAGIPYQTDNGEGIFSCTECNYTCKRRDKLKNHILNHSGEKPYACTFCDFRCKRSDKLKSHILVHTGEKPFKCDYCEHRCKRKDNMKIHMMTHTGEKPYECQFCGYKCTTSDKLKTHTMIHTGERPFSCTECEYKCTSKDKLKTHMLVHTGEKPFPCTICDYKCKRRERLKLHMMTHTGEKPFACQVCEYKCTTADRLKNHIMTHTGEKPFACKTCKYKCTTAERLKNHTMTHTGEKPFACDVCEYKCTTNDRLKTHMLIHTGEKPFACNYCEHKCTSNDKLKRHIMTHTGEKPFSCPDCEFRCTRSDKLKRHMLSHKMKKAQVVHQQDSIAHGIYQQVQQVIKSELPSTPNHDDVTLVPQHYNIPNTTLSFTATESESRPSSNDQTVSLPTTSHSVYLVASQNSYTANQNTLASASEDVNHHYQLPQITQTPTLNIPLSQSTLLSSDSTQHHFVHASETHTSDSQSASQSEHETRPQTSDSEHESRPLISLTPVHQTEHVTTSLPLPSINSQTISHSTSFNIQGANNHVKNTFTYLTVPQNNSQASYIPDNQNLHATPLSYITQPRSTTSNIASLSYQPAAILDPSQHSLMMRLSSYMIGASQQPPS